MLMRLSKQSIKMLNLLLSSRVIIGELCCKNIRNNFRNSLVTGQLKGFLASC